MLYNMIVRRIILEIALMHRLDSLIFLSTQMSLNCVQILIFEYFTLDFISLETDFLIQKASFELVRFKHESVPMTHSCVKT